MRELENSEFRDLAFDSEVRERLNGRRAKIWRMQGREPCSSLREECCRHREPHGQEYPWCARGKVRRPECWKRVNEGEIGGEIWMVIRLCNHCKDFSFCPEDRSYRKVLSRAVTWSDCSGENKLGTKGESRETSGDHYHNPEWKGGGFWIHFEDRNNRSCWIVRKRKRG